MTGTPENPCLFHESFRSSPSDAREPELSPPSELECALQSPLVQRGTPRWSCDCSSARNPATDDSAARNVSFSAHPMSFLAHISGSRHSSSALTHVHTSDYAKVACQIRPTLPQFLRPSLFSRTFFVKFLTASNSFISQISCDPLGCFELLTIDSVLCCCFS